ncbi:MAG: hypothetical protein HWD92_07865 [Flavobacteriia bacterium]|nr:hypothetical protein [Flavobacteriia bacterium]
MPTPLLHSTFEIVKGGISILLIILLLFPQFMQGFLIVDYQLRMDEIEAKYCENLDKPELECHGSCHLENELSKVTSGLDSDQETPQLLVVRVSEYLSKECDLVSIQQLVEYSTSEFPDARDGYASIPLQSITPPPQD